MIQLSPSLSRVFFGKTAVDTAFTATLFSSIFFGIYFELLDLDSELEFLNLIGLALIVATIIALCVNFSFALRKQVTHCKIMTLIEILLISLGVPCYFYTVALNIYRKPRFDDFLIKLDTILLGSFFPQGQLALYLDTNPFIGPTSSFGRFFDDVLQIVYFSYYFWPYIVTSVPFIKAVIYLFRKEKTEEEMKYESQNWQQLKSVATVWILSYLTTFFINSLIPAGSPRLMLRDQFKNPIVGFGIAGRINAAVTENRSANSFPSGHVAETLASALASLYILKQKAFGLALMFITVLMMLATIVLRYHYFVDVLMGVIVGAGSYLVVSYCIAYGKWDSSLQKQWNENMLELVSHKTKKVSKVTKTLKKNREPASDRPFRASRFFSRLAQLLSIVEDEVDSDV